MKTKLQILFVIFFTFLGSSIQSQVLPTFSVTVSNCNLQDTSGGDDNVLTFDIYIQHTNPSESGPFQLALNQYYFNFDTAVANGGMLSFTIVPGSSLFTNPNAVPRNPMVVGNRLDLLSNSVLGPGNGPIISSAFPGTRVATLRLATTAFSFTMPLNLQFRTALPNPFTKVFAYIGTTSTDVTANGTYIVNSGLCLDEPLPVELTSFTSTVNRNSVTLNWGTNWEINNSGFDVERKLISATDWTMVGNIAGNGNTRESKSYAFSDRINTGKYNYRLKQIDFNGNFTYFNLGNEVELGIPRVYNMSQNYPNPFNPTTKIDYDIPHDGKVNILLYDLTGREVANLVNEVKTAGYYSIQFNASNLASGMYFYRITAQGSSNNFVMTKKMILIK